MCGIRLRQAGEKTNRITLPFKIRYMQYKQGGTHYYFPEVTIENGRLNATFYRNRGQKGVKFTREELQAYWQAKSTVRSKEYEKLIEENGRSKADLARHLSVSRAWVSIVMRELG
jgi:Mor family transcriptional regulator